MPEAPNPTASTQSALAGLVESSQGAAFAIGGLSDMLGTLARVAGGAGVGAELARLLAQLSKMPPALREGASETEKLQRRYKVLEVQQMRLGAVVGFLAQRLQELGRFIDDTARAVGSLNAAYGHGQFRASEYLKLVNEVRLAYGKAGEDVAKRLLPQLGEMGMSTDVAGQSVKEMASYLIVGGTAARAFSGSFETIYKSLVGAGTQGERSQRALAALGRMAEVAEDSGQSVDDVVSRLSRLAYQGRALGWTTDDMLGAFTRWEKAMAEGKVDLDQFSDFMQKALSAARPENVVDQLAILSLVQRNFAEVPEKIARPLEVAARTLTGGRRGFAQLTAPELAALQQDQALAEELRAAGVYATGLAKPRGPSGKLSIQQLVVGTTFGYTAEDIEMATTMAAGERKVPGTRYRQEIQVRANEMKKWSDDFIALLKEVLVQYFQGPIADFRQEHPKTTSALMGVATVALGGLGAFGALSNAAAMRGLLGRLFLGGAAGAATEAATSKAVTTVPGYVTTVAGSLAPASTQIAEEAAERAAPGALRGVFSRFGGGLVKQAPRALGRAGPVLGSMLGPLIMLLTDATETSSYRDPEGRITEFPPEFFDKTRTHSAASFLNTQQKAFLEPTKPPPINLNITLEGDLAPLANKVSAQIEPKIGEAQATFERKLQQDRRSGI